MLSFSNEKLMEMVDNAKTRKVDYYGASLIVDLASQFLAERRERENNPGVWDGAPEWATVARPFWICTTTGKNDGKIEYGPRVFRTLPKTKAREIAERSGREFPTNDGFVTMDRETLTRLIEAAIIEAQGGEK